MQTEKDRGKKWLPPPKVEELFPHLSDGFLPPGMNATSSGARRQMELPVGNAMVCIVFKFFNESRTIFCSFVVPTFIS
jgi:hypothetical protein